MQLLDYRELPEDQPSTRSPRWACSSTSGAQLPAYFAKIRRLLRPGGLLLNHGITAAAPRHDQLGAGLGDFIERYIFPAANCCTPPRCWR